MSDQTHNPKNPATDATSDKRPLRHYVKVTLEPEQALTLQQLAARFGGGEATYLRHLLTIETRRVKNGPLCDIKTDLLVEELSRRLNLNVKAALEEAPNRVMPTSDLVTS